jgi:hypothetical protein
MLMYTRIKFSNSMYLFPLSFFEGGISIDPGVHICVVANIHDTGKCVSHNELKIAIFSLILYIFYGIKFPHI